MGHYAGIISGYALGLLIFWTTWRFGSAAWLQEPKPEYEKKFLELAIQLGAVVMVILVGQLYMRGALLPDKGEILQSLNQVVIFSPILLAAIWRGRFFASAYLPFKKLIPSLLLGGVLALCALAAYAVARGDVSNFPSYFTFLGDRDHVSYAVQVLLEDIAIAILLSRFVLAVGTKGSILMVAVLFQIAHVPAFLESGLTLEFIRSAALNTGLGLMIFGALITSRNIIWFWPIHTVMDLMQFYGP